MKVGVTAKRVCLPAPSVRRQGRGIQGQRPMFTMGRGVCEVIWWVLIWVLLQLQLLLLLLLVLLFFLGVVWREAPPAVAMLGGLRRRVRLAVVVLVPVAVAVVV